MVRYYLVFLTTCFPLAHQTEYLPFRKLKRCTRYICPLCFPSVSIGSDKAEKALHCFIRNAVKFQLLIVVVLTDRAEVRGGCPATAVLSGQKVALLAGTVLSAVAPGPLLP